MFGRRRMFIVGLALFSGASALCGAAPSLGVLVAARGLQGVGGALMYPQVLAIIQVTATAARVAAAGKGLVGGSWRRLCSWQGSARGSG